MSQDTVIKLALREIEVPGGRRPVDPAAVRRLAKSIDEIGLRHPVTVTRKGAGKFRLVAGLHRLEAARSLSMEFIDAAIVEMTATDARLWEIAENLHRAELTKLERSDQIAEWVKITDRKKGAQVVPPGGEQPHEKGVRAAAEELGLSRPEVQRSVKIAGITEEAKDAAREVGLDDNQSALLRVAAEEPSQQAAKVIEISERGKPVRIDFDIKARAARDVAEWLVEHATAGELDSIKSNLFAAGATNIAVELTNLIGTAIMDRRFK